MFAMALMLGLASVSASAQESTATRVDSTNAKPWYVGINFGVASKVTHNQFFKNINPNIGIRVGKWITPGFGLELDASFYFSRKKFNTFTYGWAQETYPAKYAGLTDNPFDEGSKLFKAYSLGLNAEFNLSNIFCGPRYTNPRAWEVIAKVGLAYGKDLTDKNDSYLDNCLLNNWGVDILYNFGSKKQFQLFLEPALIWDIYDDRATGTYFDGGPKTFKPKYIKWHSDRLAAQLRIGFNWAFSRKERVVEEPVVVPVPEPKPEPKPVVKPEPKPEPVPVVKEDPLREVFFYEIRLSDPTSVEKLDKIADWCKRHTDKQISIDSYADRETGNPRLNIGYAKARATKCAKELEKRGVPASQMIVNSYGDTVQPFAENDKNRCTIVVGK